MALKSFFDIEKFKDTTVTPGRAQSCASCGMYRYALNPKMEPYGHFEKRILILGEAPGETEDKKGKPWQGKAGDKLKNALQQFGIDLFRDCKSINSVNCRPVDDKGGNRTPDDHEIACCRKRVLKVINELNPHIILIVGGIGVKSIIGHRWQKDLGGISKWRGFVIPDRDVHSWIAPIFHTSYVERMEKYPEVNTIFMQDIENALTYLQKPFPIFPNDEDQVEIIKDDNQLKELLSGFLEQLPWIYEIDYETTGLRPYAKGHKVISMSIAPTADKAYSFLIPNDREIRQLIRQFLESSKIGLMAHNIAFERMWSIVRLKADIQKLMWCSLQAAHILDNRPGVTGLKWNVYQKYGVVDYDSSIHSYLEGIEAKNANSLNRIEYLIKEGREDELLMYGGLDSKYGYGIAMKQMGEMGYDLEDFLKELH